MSRRDDTVYLGHMLELAQKISKKTAGLTRQKFDSDENLKLALLHLVQTIGEAARHVSGPFQTAHPELPWREIVGMRNKIVHDYMDISENVLWEVVMHDIPPLLPVLEELAPPTDD